MMFKFILELCYKDIHVLRLPTLQIILAFLKKNLSQGGQFYRIFNKHSVGHWPSNLRVKYSSTIVGQQCTNDIFSFLIVEFLNPWVNVILNISCREKSCAFKAKVPEILLQSYNFLIGLNSKNHVYINHSLARL